MPYIDFTISSHKKRNNKVKPISKPKWIIKEKGVRAVVDITEDLDYIAIFKNGNSLPILKKCYSCKGHKTIYSRLLHGKYKKRLCICRVPDNTIEHYPYLPFCVGAIIIGNIIFKDNNLIEYFDVKKCIIDYEDDFARSITNAFRQIYNEELEQRIINNYPNVLF